MGVDVLADAKELQAARDASEIENHRARVVWLSAPSPKWADGVPVDAGTRHALLVQSRAALARVQGA